MFKEVSQICLQRLQGYLKQNPLARAAPLSSLTLRCFWLLVFCVLINLYHNSGIKCKEKIMEDCNVFQLCTHKKWPEVRKYLSSDAAEEEKKSTIMYRDDDGTCLHLTCYWGARLGLAPDDIIKAMLDIGGKELVMKVNINNQTALHWACWNGASYNIIKMLIDVGGKDLVMAKRKNGDTALHDLCWFIKKHTKVYEKVKLILQVGDANLLLSTKDNDGQTPLEIATDKGASEKIKNLLAVQSNSNSTTNNDSPSANIVPAENSTPITQSNQELNTTRSSSIHGLAIDQNHHTQLREAKEKAKTIQQEFDQKCIDYSGLEENYQKQLKEAKEQTLQIQQDYDQKCADCCHLEEINQVESTDNLQLGSALAMLKKDLYECKRTKVDLEKKVEAQGAERISLLAEQEGEAAHTQELLEESKRRSADLEAIVETQRSENADLSNEKDGIEKECMDKVDKLTRQLSKQHAELQQLKESSSEGEVGMKRKHTNEEHKEGECTAVAQSRTQSLKRRRGGNTRNALSGSLNTNQAEDDDAELIGMLTTRYLHTRQQLQRANARIAQFEEELDQKES
jgi:hypothetical protein